MFSWDTLSGNLATRSSQLFYLAAYKARVRLSDPFADEEILFAPIYSIAALHTTRPFAFTLHDVQEYHHPEYFSRPQRVWRYQLQSALSDRAARIVCEASHVGKISSVFSRCLGTISTLSSLPHLQGCERQWLPPIWRKSGRD